MPEPDPRQLSADWHPVTLWTVLWNDASLSVLTAATAHEAEQTARASRGRRADHWPARDVEPFLVRPIDFLELGVASRARFNEPGLGRFDVCGKTIAWMGPDTAAQFRRPGATAEWIARCACSALPPTYRLWSYVWSRDELILFTAVDFAEALRWARESGPGNAAHEEIEPIENLLVQLKPHQAGYVPTCYRVWIEGRRVGWPRTGVLTPPGPAGPPPETPLAAEARLPIPTYSRSCAYAPSRERKDRRRAVPRRRTSAK